MHAHNRCGPCNYKARHAPLAIMQSVNHLGTLQLQGTTCSISNHAISQTNHLGWQNDVRHERHLAGNTDCSAQRRPPHQPHPLISKNGLWFSRQHYKVLPPPLDMSEAAAAPAVATIPVECPGFDRCSSLQQICKDY